MLEKLDLVKQRFDEVNDLIIQPDIINDRERYVKLTKEYKELKALMAERKTYIELTENIKEAKELIADDNDDEMVEMAKLQLEEAQAELPELEEKIRMMLIPKDPEDEKDAVVEVRAGAGGDEASIFAGDIFKMLNKYCENQGWKINVFDFNEGTNGGFKEIQFAVSGENVYGTLKYEAGVHRVQRVPKTETQGRVHTSAASVMVFPEAEEFDVKINPKDVRTDYFCASGPGGQHVNNTYSAVRLTHEPTGIVVQSQDEKSQHKNKDKAFRVLRSRVYDLELAKKQEEDAEKRGSMVRTGDRSEKIRTYNYPQGRVTDHRINMDIYNLSDVMDGRIQQFIDELKLVDNTKKLEQVSDSL